MEGLFSIKSDVYSFGVLILEIVSGRRNTGFQSSEHSNLIGHVSHHCFTNAHQLKTKSAESSPNAKTLL